MHDDLDPSRHHPEAFGPAAPSARGARILVVDDEATMRLMCRSVLESDGFEVLEADDGEQALRVIESEAPELVLLDAMMPNLPGIEALEHIRRTPNGQQVPILMVTGQVDDQTINAAFEAGASDFIAKPINWAILRQRARRSVSAYRAEREVRHLAYHDTLTGLPNRRLFLERLERALVRARRYGTVVALMFIDLDGFKAVNDNFGHEAGDLLLKRVASALQTAVRSSDTVARFGGDEFNILIEDVAQPGEVRGIAEKLSATLGRSANLEHAGGRVGASIGVAVFPEDALDAAALIKCADQAMYVAKSAGVGGTHFHEGDSSAFIDEAVGTRDAAALRSLVERGELLFDFRQRIDLRTRQRVADTVRLVGVMDGSLTAEQAVEAFDQAGLSMLYLKDLLQSVLPRVDDNQPRMEPVLSLELSLTQLAASSLVEVIAAELAQNGLSGSVLEVVVPLLRAPSRSVGVDDAVISNIAAVRDLGCFVALSGRELGSVPLSLINALGVSAVRIEQAPRLLHGEPRERTELWPAWVAVARASDLRLVAADVMQAGDLPALEKLGFHAAQGGLNTAQDQPAPLLRSIGA